MIDWNFIQDQWDWLGHVVEALAISVIFMVALLWRHGWQNGLAIGLAFAAGHFHGREKRDYEVAASLSPPHLEGYLIWRWQWDQASDFWPVFIVSVVLGYILQLRGGK